MLSLKAGGTGLNLTAASHVVHFDRWWNPAIENQATDRAFRIGQKKNVLVHKFICRGTVEEQSTLLTESKRSLASTARRGGGEPSSPSCGNDELLRLVSLDVNGRRGVGGDARAGTTVLYPPYVPVAERRRKAEREAKRLAKKGRTLSPVVLEGRTIASTFWGKAWCDNLESYSDYENRLPRGRSYVRNGSVVDLQIAPGKVTALVSGSELYRIEIAIKPLAAARFAAIAKECAGQIDSAIELLRGKISAGVMAIMTRPGGGLFPTPAEIDLDCSCPDYAGLCKHLAAVLYGVGARLDSKPELLFVLRGVDHADLVSEAAVGGAAVSAPAKGKVLATADLGGIFGIEIAEPALVKAKTPRKKKPGAVLITTKDLLARGVPRSTFQNWVQAGVLERTSVRGVYKKTGGTEARIASFLAGRRARG